MKALSRASGLTAIMAQRGVASAALDACYASKAAQAPVLAMTNDAWNVRKIGGTPAFFIGGKPVDAHHWAEVESSLRSALKLKPKAG